MVRIFALVAALLALVILAPASATPAFHPNYATPQVIQQWRPVARTVRQHRVIRHRAYNHAARWHHAQRPSYGRQDVIGGRPRGCPYEYCGCSASLFLFHRIIGALNLAANWLRFPHAAPAPGMAAVAPSHHHVVVLEHHVRGSIWFVHDGNNGHHLTRDHPRNIAGWTIVDPRRA